MKIRFYKHICSVQRYWKEIIPDNHVRFYQTYMFNRICYNYRKSSLSNIKKGNCQCCFAVAFRNDKPVCIAPLIIDIKPNSVVGLLGTGTNAGVLDFIYNENTLCSDIIELYNACRMRFSNADFLFYFVPEFSPLVKEMNIREKYSNYAVHLDSYEQYYSTLSKNTKQNIRTAYNRLNREELTYTLEIVDKNSENIERIIEELNEIYLKRRLVWNDSANLPSARKRRMIAKRDVVYQTMRKTDAARICQLKINDVVAAFFMGYEVENRFYVPRLAIGEGFEKFSPGMILINEFQKLVPNHFVFDLGRGDESYKSRLNGAVYWTYQLEMKK